MKVPRDSIDITLREKRLARIAGRRKCEREYRRSTWHQSGNFGRGVRDRQFGRSDSGNG